MISPWRWESRILLTDRWLDEIFPVSHSSPIFRPSGIVLIASNRLMFLRSFTDQPSRSRVLINAIFIGLTPFPWPLPLPLSGQIIKLFDPEGHTIARMASSISRTHCAHSADCGKEPLAMINRVVTSFIPELPSCLIAGFRL